MVTYRIQLYFVVIMTLKIEVLYHSRQILSILSGLESTGIVGHYRHIGFESNITRESNTIFDSILCIICLTNWNFEHALCHEIAVIKIQRRCSCGSNTKRILGKRLVRRDQPVNNVHQIAPVLMTHGVVKLNFKTATRSGILSGSAYTIGGSKTL